MSAIFKAAFFIKPNKGLRGNNILCQRYKKWSIYYFFEVAMTCIKFISRNSERLVLLGLNIFLEKNTILKIIEILYKTICLTVFQLSMLELNLFIQTCKT